MNEYPKALSSYEKALEIRTTITSSESSRFGYFLQQHREWCTTNWASIRKHFRLTKKHLKFDNNSLPPNRPDLASSYNNIGRVYDQMGEYSKALSSHKKALEIKQQLLPPNHPDLASSYNNIGVVHHHMGNYSTARSFYENAVNIAQHSLLSNHPHLLM